MNNDLVQVIDEIVEVIYRLEIKEIEKKIVDLLDGLELHIKENPNKEWDEVVINLQNAYVKKDYVELADILLYDMKMLLYGLK